MSMPCPVPCPLIRDAVPADRPVIVEFNRLLAVETEHKVLDPAILDRGVARALADPDRLRYWVAEIPIGRRPPARRPDRHHPRVERLANGWIWWLQSVYIHADFRGQGIFRALYQHICDQALAASDVIGLRLYVENGNLRAQQTYQALGMKPGGYSVLEELWLHRSRVD